MTEFNPYKILGVPVDASPEEIKSAWRKLVNQHHPDRGGDREKYEDVIRANDILSDPARRGQFDRTGKVDQTGADNMHASAVNFLVGYFTQCMEQTVDAGRDPCQIDLVQLGISYLKKNVLDLRAQQQRPHKLVAALERAVKRLKKKSKLEDGSILHVALSHQITNYWRTIEGMEEQIDLMNAALGIIMDYSFDVERMMAIGQSPYVYSTNDWRSMT
jgi:curved DNA-binding protein CbpA